MERMRGKLAVVTGGASGIGRAIGLAFAREGARVAVLDLWAESASAVAAEAGVAIRVATAATLAIPRRCGQTFADVARDLGAVDVLVNNAGIAVRRQEVQDRALANIEAMMTGRRAGLASATSTLDDETWDRTLRVHLYGTFHCSREALRVMEHRGSGVICNIELGSWSLGL